MTGTNIVLYPHVGDMALPDYFVFLSSGDSGPTCSPFGRLHPVQKGCSSNTLGQPKRQKHSAPEAKLLSAGLLGMGGRYSLAAQGTWHSVTVLRVYDFSMGWIEIRNAQRRMISPKLQVCFESRGKTGSLMASIKTGSRNHPLVEIS